MCIKVWRFGDDAVLVQIAGQLESADHPRGIDPLHLQHIHVELGVVGNDDVIYVTDQLLKLVVCITPLEGWF